VRNLLFSICSLVLLQSCSPSLFNDFRRSNSPLDLHDAGWFGNNDGSTRFRVSVNAGKKNTTGIMVLKLFSDDSHRVVFMTEMGIKIFDIEIYRNGSHKLHYSVEELNRRTMISMLGNDLSLMIYPFTSTGSLKIMERKDGSTVLRIKDKRGRRYAFIDNHSGKLQELISSGTLFRKVRIKYTGKGSKPEKIEISHNFLKLDITLTLLK
jgi:hypothetical protein